MIKTLKQHQFLFRELVKRDFRQKYKKTTLGFIWSILNPLAEFLIGLAMLAAGGYWFLNSVSVSTGFYTLRLGGFYMNGGLVVVPFIAGVIWFCVNTDSFGAKLLMGAGLVIIIASVIAATEFRFRYTSLYNYLIMLILMFGGAALVLKVLCHDPDKKRKKDD